MPWPFFIQWDQSDETRLSWERAGAHSNGASRVVGVSVAVNDLDAAAGLYERRLGIAMTGAEDAPEIGARRRVARLGSFEIAVHAAQGEGPIAQRLRDVGQGIYEVTLATTGAARMIDGKGGLGARFVLRQLPA